MEMFCEGRCYAIPASVYSNETVDSAKIEGEHMKSWINAYNMHVYIHNIIYILYYIILYYIILYYIIL